MTDDLVKRLRDRVAMTDKPWATTPAMCAEAADRIKELQAALSKIIQKCPYARREKWCSCLDCNCVIARAALEEKTND